MHGTVSITIQYIIPIWFQIKGTVARDCLPLLGPKNSTWATYDQAKTVSWHFSYLLRYSIRKKQESGCLRSHCLRWLGVGIVIDYSTLTRCSRSLWFCGHRVGVVVDNVDTCWWSHWLCGHGVPVVTVLTMLSPVLLFYFRKIKINLQDTAYGVIIHI